jgi:hypothetical protein
MDSWVYWLIYFVVAVIIAWVVLALIILWFHPAFVNSDGSVNWWTTFWVAILIIVFAWLLILILNWIIGLFQGPNCVTCGSNPCLAPKCAPTCVKTCC